MKLEVVLGFLSEAKTNIISWPKLHCGVPPDFSWKEKIENSDGSRNFRELL
jgi:hypothetical protein